MIREGFHATPGAAGGPGSGVGDARTRGDLKMGTVLVVDDEERLRGFLTRSFVSEGHAVMTAHNGAAALAILARHDVEMVLLDLVMPQVNGLQVLARLGKREHMPPVIVLSAVTDVSARVKALDAGAVDFVMKPFHTAELVARVRRHLQAAPPSSDSDRYVVAGAVRLDMSRRRAEVGEQAVTLTEREFALLAHLIRRRGDVCGREELLRAVWGLDDAPGSNVIEVCVRRLRRKLSDLPIETVRGSGYCFVGA